MARFRVTDEMPAGEVREAGAGAGARVAVRGGGRGGMRGGGRGGAGRARAGRAGGVLWRVEDERSAVACVRAERTPRSLMLAAALGMALLVATLVPLVLISRYNHSYADDWHYGVWAHLTLEQTGNVGLALITALEQVGKAWFDWQGTYSAILLMAIQPGVFGEQAYALAAPLVMASLVAGTFFFAHALLVELLGAPRGAWLAVSSVAVAVELLAQPSPVEGIFWYNSAVYYTSYHAAALALMGTWARICNPARTRRPRGVVVASVLLALFVAGGNFVTALVAAEVMFAVLAVLIAQGRRSSYDVLPSFGVMVLGLALSLAAPGNDVRQQTQFPGDGAGVLGTIWQSSLAAFQYLEQWSGGLVLLALAFAVPLALYVGERAAARGWRFRLPGLVAAGSMALFATSFTPTFWAEGTVGPGRVQDCRFDLLVTLLLVCVFWCSGWLCARMRAARVGVAAGELVAAEGAGAGELAAAEGAGAVAGGALGSGDAAHVQAFAVSARHAALGCALAALVAVCVVGSMAADKSLGEELSSVSAARSLASGQAAAYHEQVLSRLETIEGSSEQSLRVPFYTNVPHVLLMGDIRDNMDNYINYRLCQWYGKESIVGYRGASASSAGSGDTASSADAASSAASSPASAEASFAASSAASDAAGSEAGSAVSSSEGAQ